MIQKILFENAKNNIVLLVVFLLSAFILAGCGSSGGGGGSSESYSEPAGTITATPLMSVATLKSWIDAGYVGAGEFNHVVILDYGSDNTKGWLPGAVTVGVSEIRQTRIEGVAWASSLVGTGEQIDTLIQRSGITANSTIVITTNGEAYMSARLYWTLRYWGFPKNKLKVLDGGNNVYDALYDMSLAESAPVSSTYSVSHNAALQANLRASIGEVIIDVVPDNGDTQLTIDTRGATGYNGATKTGGDLDKTLNSAVTDHKTVMEGHVAGGTYIVPTFYNIDGTYKSIPELEALSLGNGTPLGNIGATYDKTTVYCGAGYSASQLFFVLDALLDVNVQLYDGSMSQWMQYATVRVDADENGLDDNTGAGLPVSSPWSVEDVTDVAGVFGSGPNFNTDNGVPLDKIEEIRYLGEEATEFPTPASVPNQVEDEDADYMNSGGTITTPPSPFSDNGAVGC